MRRTGAIFQLLVVTLLFICTAGVSTYDRLTCRISRGEWRDCMCGDIRRDSEILCHDADTYYERNLTQEIRNCEFRCENGGTYDNINKHCSCPQGYHGLCCESESRKMISGGVLRELNGTIESFGFSMNYNYPPDQRVVWRIITDPTRRIALSVKDNHFTIPQGSTPHTCDQDWIAIYDGPDMNAQKIGTYCGNQMRKLETVYSSNSELYIEFVSAANTKSEDRGRFKLHYTTFLRGRECGPRDSFSLQTGIITSPNYPVNYKENEHCEYEILALPNQDIIIEMLEIDLPARADCSKGDKLRLIKKSNKSEDPKVLAVFCGNKPFPQFTVKEPTSVILEFTSDSREGGTFKLRYNQVPSSVSTLEVH